MITLPFLNHIYELPPVAVSSTVLPSQIEALAGDIVPVGTDASETTEVFDAGPLQPPWLIITLYVPTWVTVNVASVSPLISFPSRNHV